MSCKQHPALNTPDFAGVSGQGIPLMGIVGGMNILFNILLFLHLVGFASLFGGAFVQMKGPNRVINPAIFHGALTQLVTGILLVGVKEMGDIGNPVNNIKIGVKLLVLIAIFVMVFINRKKDNVPAGQFWAILALTLINAGIAVFW